MKITDFVSYSMYTKAVSSGNEFQNLMKQAENQEESWTFLPTNYYDTISNQWFHKWNSTSVQLHHGHFHIGRKQETIQVKAMDNAKPHSGSQTYWRQPTTLYCYTLLQVSKCLFFYKIMMNIFLKLFSHLAKYKFGNAL